MDNKNVVLIGILAVIGLSSFTNDTAGATGNDTGNSPDGLISFLNKSNLSKGLRNNNPLNIHHSKRKYSGELTPTDKDSDGKFLCRFKSIEYGLKAAKEHLQLRYATGQIGKTNCYGWTIEGKRDNILKIIYTWVCGSNPSRYIDFVEQKSSYTRTQTLNLNDSQTLFNLMYAMSLYENGVHYQSNILSVDNFNKYFQKALELQ